jgi:hypothetical protein
MAVPEAAADDLVADLAAGEMPRSGLAAWFRDRIDSRSRPRLGKQNTHTDQHIGPMQPVFVWRVTFSGPGVASGRVVRTMTGEGLESVSNEGRRGAKERPVLQGKGMYIMAGTECRRRRGRPPGDAGAPGPDFPRDFQGHRWGVQLPSAVARPQRPERADDRPGDSRFQTAGLQVWGLTHTQGKNPVMEAHRAASRVRQWKLDGLVVNPQSSMSASLTAPAVHGDSAPGPRPGRGPALDRVQPVIAIPTAGPGRWPRSRRFPID